MIYIQRSKNIKQVLHELSVSNTPRREEELNIISSRVNKYDIQRNSNQDLLLYTSLFKNTNKKKKYHTKSNIKF